MLESMLHDIFIIFAVSTAVTVAFNVIRLPAVVGFIISGVIVGPSGFAWINDLDSIQQIAELGLIFLLFTIGVEFSLKNLMGMKRLLLGAGSIQFGLVTLVGMAGAVAFGIDPQKAFLMGSMMALSSTAVVLKSLHQRREVVTPHGSLAVGMLLFQDLMVVPLMLLVPYLGTTELTADWTHLLIQIGIKGGAVLAAIIIGSRYVIPALFKVIARSGDRDVFIISVALLIFFSAWISHEIGLSLALGAFIAGILISESPYGHQATADMIAWREPLVAIFFVSVGMLLDLDYFLEHPMLITLASLAILLVKTVLNSISGSLIGVMRRSSIISGLMLSQVGEFSFILADRAQKLGVITSSEYQFLLSVIVLTLLVSPLIIRFTPVLAPQLLKTDFLGHLIERVLQDRSRAEISPHNGSQVAASDHVIIIGFGNNGRNLASVLKEIGIPYQVIESNASTFEGLKHEPIHFGDGGKIENLESANIREARAVVVTINDPVWIQKVILAVRSVRPDVNLIVRLQYFLDLSRIENCESVEPVVAEAETAKMIVRKVLGYYEVPPEDIETIVN